MREDTPSLSGLRLVGEQSFGGRKFLWFHKDGNPQERFFIDPVQIVALREQRSGAPMGGSGRAARGGFPGGFASDPDATFSALTGGKDVWVRADIPADDEVGQRRFDRMAQQLGITDGKITRQQYRALMRTRVAQQGGGLPAAAQPPAPQRQPAFREIRGPQPTPRSELTDQSGRVVVVDIWVAAASAAKDEGGKLPVDKHLDEREFSGPAESVAAKLEALRKKGQLASVLHIVLTAVEGVPVQVGDTKSTPYVTGMTGFGRAGGVASKVISYRDLGTQATLQVRITSDKKARARITLSDAHAQPAGEGVALGNDAGGAEVPATEFVLAHLDTELMVPLGQAVLAKGVQTTSKSGQAQVLVVVAARLREPESGASK
jgi:hypothetical protein